MATTDRPLTSGEIDLARTIFSDAIAFDRVRLIHRPWFPLQPKNTVMAPMGNIHFHPRGETWSNDFASDTIAAQGLFIHELTHVWQAQTKGRFWLPLMRHPFCKYRYELRPGRPFNRYGIEQQAEIVRHLFLRRLGAQVGPAPAEQLAPLLPFG